jgi:hypothetical protein
MVRDIRSLFDAQVALREVDDRLNKLATQNMDLNGRRVVNAGASQADSDYVIQKQITDEVGKLNSDIASIKAQLARIETRLIAAGI